MHFKNILIIFINIVCKILQFKQSGIIEKLIAILQKKYRTFYLCIKKLLTNLTVFELFNSCV